MQNTCKFIQPIRVFIQSITFLTIGILLLCFLGLSACQFPPRLYKMDVQQGNALSAEMIRKLRVGMSKQQVQETLGTPTLTHIFDKNRWDYYYSLVPGTGGPKVVKPFSVFFRNGRVVSFGESIC